MSSIQKTANLPDVQVQIDRLTRRVESLASKIKSNKEVPKKDYYRPTEVCQLLGISRSKFESYKRSGIFPVKRMGGSVYVASADVLKHFSGDI